MKKAVIIRSLYSSFAVLILSITLWMAFGLTDPIEYLNGLLIAIPTLLMLITNLLNSVGFYISIWKNRKNTNRTYSYYRKNKPAVFKVISYILITITSVAWSFFVICNFVLLSASENLLSKNLITNYQYTNEDDHTVDIQITAEPHIDVIFWTPTAFAAEGDLKITDSSLTGNAAEPYLDGRIEYFKGFSQGFLNRYSQYYENQITEYISANGECISTTRNNIQIKYAVSNINHIGILLMSDNKMMYISIQLNNDFISEPQYFINIVSEYFEQNG